MRESLVQRQITDWLTAKHIFHVRVNTGAIRIEKRVFRAHSLGPGCADILIPLAGSTWIECKSNTGRQTGAQRAFEHMVRERGDRYIVARSIDDLERIIDGTDSR